MSDDSPSDDRRDPPGYGRRATDYATPGKPPASEVAVLLSLLHDDVKTVKGGVAALDDRLSKHMADETMELATVVADIMRKAFPEGDPLGHRKHHEAVIRAAEERAAFWKKMREEVGKFGLLGVLGWLTFVAWTAFLKGPAK